MNVTNQFFYLFFNINLNFNLDKLTYVFMASQLNWMIVQEMFMLLMLKMIKYKKFTTDGTFVKEWNIN